MRKCRKYSLTLIVVIMLATTSAFSQEFVRQTHIQGGPRGGFVRTGNEGAVVVSHVGIESKGGPAGISVWSGGGQVNLNVLKDFPSSNRVQIWDVAVLPTGGIAAAVILEEPQDNSKHPKLRDMIVSYDKSGSLKEAWDVSPYEFISIAADQEGNVYGFGERSDMSESSDLPMVVKYSSRGGILREFLPRSVFSQSQDPADINPAIGRSYIRAGLDGSIMLYVAGTQELISMRSDGTGIKRVQLGRTLEANGKLQSGAQIRVLSLAITNDGSVLLQVVTTSLHRTITPIFAFNRELQLVRSSSNKLPAGHLVGVDEDGNLIFHRPGANQKPDDIDHYPRASILGSPTN